MKKKKKKKVELYSHARKLEVGREHVRIHVVKQRKSLSIRGHGQTSSNWKNQSGGVRNQ